MKHKSKKNKIKLSGLHIFVLLLFIFYFPAVFVLFPDTIIFIDFWILLYIIILGTVLALFFLSNKNLYIGKEKLDFKSRFEIIYIIATFIILAVALLSFQYSIYKEREIDKDIESNIKKFLCEEYKNNINIAVNSINLLEAKKEDGGYIIKYDTSLSDLYFQDRAFNYAMSNVTSFNNFLIKENKGIEEIFDDYNKILIANKRLDDLHLMRAVNVGMTDDGLGNNFINHVISSKDQQIKLINKLFSNIEIFCEENELPDSLNENKVKYKELEDNITQGGTTSCVVTNDNEE